MLFPPLEVNQDGKEQIAAVLEPDPTTGRSSALEQMSLCGIRSALLSAHHVIIVTYVRTDDKMEFMR